MKDAFFQVSTLKALMLGNFQGAYPVEKLLEQGSYGIGTYEGMDGEAILWDGVAYNGRADGKCYVMQPHDTVAFSIVTHFTPAAKELPCPAQADLESLKAWLDAQVQREYGNQNAFYFIKAQGRFRRVLVRSCYQQQPPYLPLAQVAKDQMEYAYQDVVGCLTGIWCPAYVDGLNMPGWHIHFLDENRTCGGHVLQLAVESAAFTLEQKTHFEMVLPHNPSFAQLDLTQDLSAETARVEGESQK